jgi:hypothetical protein
VGNLRAGDVTDGVHAATGGRHCHSQLCGCVFGPVNADKGSAATVRDQRIQPFGAEIAENVGRHPRTTAVAISALSDGNGEGQVAM